MKNYKTNFLDLRLCDCMELMREYPDKYFDLAIVDPPYGIGASDYKRGGTQHGNSKAKCKEYGSKNWDNATPTTEYWNELKRISKNQIIWGANHFISDIPFNSSGLIVWDKENGDNGYADCELAWTSFKSAVRKFKWKWQGMLQQNMKNKQERIHPTQKPIELYEFCLKNYADNGFKIIDTHFGSGSIALAVHKANQLDKMNLHLTACEIDEEYFDKSVQRIQREIRQSTLQF